MEKKFETRGVAIRYDVSEGDPALPWVVAMHGWGCTAQTLASVTATCARAGNRVLAVDFPGFGGSSEPPEPWGTDDYARAVEALLDAEGVERPVLLGHSFGGRVGITIASRRPVAKLVLVDAAGVKPRRGPRYYYKVYTYKAMKRLMRLVYGREGAQRRLDRRRVGSADYAGSSPMMRRVMSRVVNEDLCHLMPRIQAPTLLIWGENDTATPLRDAQKMERLIPDAGLVSMPGCGHFSFLDNPGQFQAVLTSFLKS